MVSAAARHECRGAHTVDDYEHPATRRSKRYPLGRNDIDWLQHTLWYNASNSLVTSP